MLCVLSVTRATKVCAVTQAPSGPRGADMGRRHAEVATGSNVTGRATNSIVALSAIQSPQIRREPNQPSRKAARIQSRYQRHEHGGQTTPRNRQSTLHRILDGWPPTFHRPRRSYAIRPLRILLGLTGESNGGAPMGRGS